MNTNKKIQILDHGYIELLEYMGSDTSIAQSARVSTQSDGKNDRGLIRRLMRDNHTSPFEMGEIKIRIKAPIFVFRQMFRHRTANLNEQSLRYTESECEFYLPTIERMQAQSLDNRQGSGEMLSYENAEKCLDIISNSHQTASSYCLELLELGLTRELARNVLEFSLYSSADWKCDLHNILKFLKLRTDSHAQWEFQQYAIAIENIVKELYPITYNAWVDYVKDSVTFSRMEMEIIKQFGLDLTTINANSCVLIKNYGLTQSEYDNFLRKLKC